jgi:hypothetical protein
MCSILSLCVCPSISSWHILHLLSSPSLQYLFSLSSFKHLNLAIIFLSPQVLKNFLCHTPFILPVVSGFFDSFPFSLLVFVPTAQYYIYPFSFRSPSFHFFTDIPVPLVVLLSLSLFLLLVLFIFSPAFRQYPALFPSIHFLSPNFPAFTLGLFLLHSSFTMLPGISLSTPSIPLKYFSCTFSTSFSSFHPQMSAPLSCSRTSSFSS